MTLYYLRYQSLSLHKENLDGDSPAAIAFDSWIMMYRGAGGFGVTTDFGNGSPVFGAGHHRRR